jgi:hypothetical protein
MAATALQRALRRILLGWLLAWLAPCVLAQVTLPGVPVPPVGSPELPVRVDGTLDGTRDRLARQAADLRQLQVRDLLRTQRALVERDADGAPVLRGEVVAIAPTPAALQVLQRAGFRIERSQPLDGLALHAVVLGAPAGSSARAAVRLARRLDPQGAYDYNHLYWRSATGTTPMPPPRSPGTHAGASRLRVGLVDSGVDGGHPALAGTAITHWGCGGTPVPDAHGTAVASLLAGSAVSTPGSGHALYAADVYCGRPTGGAASELAQALAWLARERVAVINVSLVGPRNALVERTIAQLAARGHVIVAAVGNDGPAAPPLFPAGYADVIGVSAVDARQRVLPEAGRGPHVAFAAPGLGLPAAATGHAWQRVRGTSYAAPLVARLAAGWLDTPDPVRARELVGRLAEDATPPPEARADRYGRGILGTTLPLPHAPSSR